MEMTSSNVHMMWRLIQKDLYMSQTEENNNVQKFTHNGTFVKAWGSRGSGNGQFVIPYSIDIDSNDNVFVVDRETTAYKSLIAMARF